MQVCLWTAPSCVGDFDHRVKQVGTVGLTWLGFDLFLAWLGDLKHGSSDDDEDDDGLIF